MLSTTVRTIFILSLTYLPIEGRIHNDTKICIKRNQPRAVISQDTDFRSFVINSTVWADKSTLVTGLTEGEETLKTITAAHGWGKTLNLSMLKYFFGIEVDKMGNVRLPEDTWAYQYFVKGKIFADGDREFELIREPSISWYPDIEKHLCRYPVIFLNVGGINADNLPEYHELREQIAENYEKYLYIRDNWTNIIGNAATPGSLRENAKQDLEKFDKILNKKENNLEELKSSIRWLSKLLHQYHRTKCIILIDDYDGIIRNLSTINFRKAFKGEVEYFYREFMTKSLMDNDDLQWGVITGILRISEFTSGLLNISEYNFIDCPSPYPWYGFTFDEFFDLMQIAKFSERLVNESMLFYDGYRYLQRLTNHIYCPLSIARLVSTKIVAQYWKLSDTAIALFKLMRHQEYRRRFTIAHLCRDQRTIISYGGMFRITYNDAEDLSHLIRNPYDAATEYYHRAFGVLMMMGHFSQHVQGNWYTKRPVRFLLQYIQIRIPNMELRSQICDPAFITHESHLAQTAEEK